MRFGGASQQVYGGDGMQGSLGGGPGAAHISTLALSGPSLALLGDAAHRAQIAQAQAQRSAMMMGGLGNVIPGGPPKRFQYTNTFGDAYDVSTDTWVSNSCL